MKPWAVRVRCETCGEQDHENAFDLKQMRGRKCHKCEGPLTVEIIEEGVWKPDHPKEDV